MGRLAGVYTHCRCHFSGTLSTNGSTEKALIRQCFVRGWSRFLGFFFLLDVPKGNGYTFRVSYSFLIGLSPFLKKGLHYRDVARNYMKMNPANRFSRGTAFSTKLQVRPAFVQSKLIGLANQRKAMTLISLRICAGWYESFLSDMKCCRNAEAPPIWCHLNKF